MNKKQNCNKFFTVQNKGSGQLCSLANKIDTNIIKSILLKLNIQQNINSPTVRMDV